MGMRFPGADTPEEYWQNLLSGVESLTEIDEETLRQSGVPEARISDPAYVRLRPLIEGIELFDERYFGITPRDADILNPQHRLFIEVCDVALQRAAIDPARSVGRVGVFAGASPNRYIDHVYSDEALREAIGDIAVEIANQPDYLATRTSHLLGLDGPSVSVATACSTSLVAVHLACQSLAADECEERGDVRA